MGIKVFSSTYRSSYKSLGKKQECQTLNEGFSMRETCFKCKESFNREALFEIYLTVHLATDSNCYLCPTCLETWVQIYNRWKRTRHDDFWNRGWDEFLKRKAKNIFNPSMRGST
jgi:hypothetical protein